MEANGGKISVWVRSLITQCNLIYNELWSDFLSFFLSLFLAGWVDGSISRTVMNSIAWRRHVWIINAQIGLCVLHDNNRLKASNRKSTANFFIILSDGIRNWHSLTSFQFQFQEMWQRCEDDSGEMDTGRLRYRAICPHFAAPAIFRYLIMFRSYILNRFARMVFGIEFQMMLFNSNRIKCWDVSANRRFEFGICWRPWAPRMAAMPARRKWWNRTDINSRQLAPP